MRRLLACLGALATLAGCGGGGNASSQTTTAAQTKTQTQTTKVEVLTPAGGARSSFDPRTIYKSEAPGVVTLLAINGGHEALGSGFVVDADGDIATNAHVVTNDSGAEANQVYVQFADGNKLPARILGTDLDSDVAVVKVDPSQLRGPDAKIVALPFGSTSELKVGDPVAAIGSPFGEQQSLSVGVVSALN